MNTIFKIIFFALCSLLVTPPKLYCQEEKDYDAVLLINKNNSKKVSPVLYGLHYEEIGMIGEGALHAELIRNRSFEEATPPAGLAVKNGIYQDVPNPHGNNKKVFQADPLIGWSTYPYSYTPIFISRTTDSPMNEENRHSMRVRVSPDIRNYPQAAILNEGYFGMNLRKDVPYKFSMNAKQNFYKGSIEIYLTDELGNPISQPLQFDLQQKEWTKFTGELIPEIAVKRGMLAIKPLSEGDFQLNVVSLFPGDTWDIGKSVFRSDIVENLVDLSPDFIRFPGGCIVHGTNEETMYKWKKTIGPIENRPGQWSKWAPYYRTDGIGYHEFYELCEYVGAEAMYVIPTGMICTEWVPSTSPWKFTQPDVDLEYYIQDALDAIEYAIGDINTQWGALRAQNGHPEPFPLKYIEIGNEDFGPVYWERYEKIYQALHEKYPNLVYIANSIIGKNNDNKRGDISNFVNPKNVKVFDEHYYQPIEWACRQHERFDNYERGIADLFIGELGIDGPYPANILATGAVRMSLERNGDMNTMLAERPVMRHWDFIQHRNASAILILNSVDSSVKTFHFHICKMFKDNTFDKYIQSKIIQPQELQDVFVTMGYDSSRKEYILKLINISNKKRVLKPEITGFRKTVKARKTELKTIPGVNNTPESPDMVKPTESETNLNLNSYMQVEPFSFTIYRFK